MKKSLAIPQALLNRQAELIEQGAPTVPMMEPLLDYLEPVLPPEMLDTAEYTEEQLLECAAAAEAQQALYVDYIAAQDTIAYRNEQIEARNVRKVSEYEEALTKYNEELASLETELSKYGEQDMSPEEEAAILAQQAEHDAKQPERDAAALREQALKLLDKTDLVAIRCMKAGIPFPPDWQQYVSDLRAIVQNGTGAIPTQPNYPQGA